MVLSVANRAKAATGNQARTMPDVRSRAGFSYPVNYSVGPPVVAFPTTPLAIASAVGTTACLSDWTRRIWALCSRSQKGAPQEITGP